MGTSRTIPLRAGRRYAAVAAVALGLLAAACGDDATSSQFSAKGSTVNVKAVDHGFEGLPASVKAAPR